MKDDEEDVLVHKKPDEDDNILKPKEVDVLEQIVTVTLDKALEESSVLETETPHKKLANDGLDDEGEEIEARHVNVKVEKIDLKCHVCGYEASGATSLHIHSVKYHKKHSFYCNICFKTFGFVSNLRAHRKNHFEADYVTLKQGAIIVHLQERKGREGELNESEKVQVEAFEQKIDILKQKPVLKMGKIIGGSDSGLIEETVLEEEDVNGMADVKEETCNKSKEVC